MDSVNLAKCGKEAGGGGKADTPGAGCRRHGNRRPTSQSEPSREEQEGRNHQERGLPALADRPSGADGAPHQDQDLAAGQRISTGDKEQDREAAQGTPETGLLPVP